MTPKEKRDAANKVLDDTMTVSDAKKRKLELRAKDLEIRKGSLERKKAKDAEAKASKEKRAKDSAADKRASEVVAGIRKRKERKAAAEKKKADNLKGIADKRKAGVKKSLDRAKEMAKKSKVGSTITKDEGEASAELKLQKDAVKGAVGAARAGLNLGKAAAKGIGAGIAGARAKKAQGKIDAKERKIEKRNEKIDAARDKKVKDRLNRRRMSKLNPFKSKSDKSADSKPKSPNTSDQKLEASRKDSSTKSAAKTVEKKPEVKKPEAKKPEVKKETGVKRRALKAAAGKAAKAGVKAGAKFVAKKAVSKVAPPTRKALPSGQKALPPSGGVNKPKPQSKPAAGGGTMSDAERARKDPEFRRKLIQQRDKGMNEEFYQYLMEIEKMEKKTDKIIDIMKGKNKIEISPKSVSEEVTGGVLIQDVEDYTPLEIETVDVIKPEPLMEKPMNEERSDTIKDRQLERGGHAVRPSSHKNTNTEFGKKKPSKETAMDFMKKKYGNALMKKEGYSDWRSEMEFVQEGEGKKDACYHKVKRSAKVWPSAYASGRLVQCRKKGAANYGNSKKD